MKKLLLVLAVCFFSFHSVSAQDQTGRFSLGANVSYGTKIESLGIAMRAQYGFLSNVRGVLEYKYYIDRHNLSAWGWAADAHYLFNISSAVSIYPIGGVTISRWTWDPSRSKMDGIKYSNNRIGMNLGLGTQIAMGDKTYLQVEAKEALIKDFTQFVVSVGFIYQF